MLVFTLFWFFSYQILNWRYFNVSTSLACTVYHELTLLRARVFLSPNVSSSSFTRSRASDQWTELIFSINESIHLSIIQSINHGTLMSNKLYLYRGQEITPTLHWRSFTTTNFHITNFEGISKKVHYIEEVRYMENRDNHPAYESFWTGISNREVCDRAKFAV